MNSLDQCLVPENFVRSHVWMEYANGSLGWRIPDELSCSALRHPQPGIDYERDRQQGPRKLPHPVRALVRLVANEEGRQDSNGRGHDADGASDAGLKCSLFVHVGREAWAMPEAIVGHPRRRVDRRSSSASPAHPIKLLARSCLRCSGLRLTLATALTRALSDERRIISFRNFPCCCLLDALHACVRL